MQLSAMDRTERCNMNERCLEFGDKVSHDDHSGDEKCDCNSVDGEGTRLKSSLIVSEGAGTIDEIHVPNHTNDIGISHQHLFPKNHSLNALGNFIGIANLPGISNLQPNDVLEKLKMQVRDIKVGLKDNECAMPHSDAIGSNLLATPMNKTLTIPATTMISLTHGAQTLVSQANNNLSPHLSTIYSMKSSLSSNGCHSSFPFTSPTAPTLKDGNPASNSSTSSETSNSSQQTTGWSFEEQYKQVRQLYEINNDPQRKEFLDDLFSFMQKRGTPITRLPIMAKHVLDLYELYKLVVERGGLVDVINKKLWQEVIKGLELPSSITSAAFTLRTQYMKYLYPYECEKLGLSTAEDLKIAVLGNRREGRRTSMNQYDTIPNPIQMNPLPRQSVPGDMQHLAPISLVSHANNTAVAVAVAKKIAQSITTSDERMYNYLNYFGLGNGEADVNKELSNACITSQQNQQIQFQQLSHHQIRQIQQFHDMHNAQSSEISRRYGINTMDMSQLALLQSIRNNNSQCTPETSTRGNAHYEMDDIKRIFANAIMEGINSTDSNTNSYTGKRKQENIMEITEHNNFHNNLPPCKRSGFNSSPITRANGEKSDDDEHNLSENSSPVKRRNSNKNIHNNKSDDSTNENSPTTSGTFTDKTKNRSVYSSKYHSSISNNITPETPTSLGQCENLNMLSAMHFHVTRNGINSDGKQEVEVSLELNGVEYTGVLKANTKNHASEVVSSLFPTTVAANNDKIYNKKSIKKSHNEDIDISNCYQETSSESHISAHNSKNDTDFSEDLTVAKNTNEQKMRDIDMDSFPTTSTGKRNGL